MFKRMVFKIPETNPLDISMTRLVEYLAELATVVGNREDVHFLKVEEGSLPCIMEVEADAEPRIISRVKDIVSGKCTEEARIAYNTLREFLQEDKCSAELTTESGDVILDFPFGSEETAQEYGPFWQDGSLDGRLMKIGGMDETIPVHLLYEGSHHICNADVETAKKLGHYLLQKPIRVHGKGQWFRNRDGKWEMRRFDITDFEDLDDSSLPEIVSRLRAIPGNTLVTLKNPLGELRKVRHGE